MLFLVHWTLKICTDRFLFSNANNSPSVFDVCSSKFAQFNEITPFAGLERMDFIELLKLCLEYDSIYLDGKNYVQNCGIPMGNNLAPTLAIFYMDKIEQELMCHYQGSVYCFLRYIDDIFFVIDRSIPISQFVNTANSINQSIQFTVEEPNVSNSLPFLDTVVQYNPNLSYSLYIKPVHSNSILHSSSHVPVHRKINLIRNEFARCQARSSNELNASISINIMRSRFTNNGYNTRFINKHNNARRPILKSNEFTTFLKIPFQSNSASAKIKSYLKSANLQDKIRLVFYTERPLHRQIAPNKQLQKCPTDCLTCHLAERPGICHKKDFIYKISCNVCRNFTYFGESKRLATSRITEHTTDKNSLVYKHMHEFHPNQLQEFSWNIIMSAGNWHTRTAIEHMLAKENNCHDQKVRDLNYAVIA